MDNKHWETVFGWFDFQVVYDIAVARLKEGDIAIEIGTFLGKSTCYLAQRIKESGKKINFYACDVFYHDPKNPDKVNWDGPTGDFYPKFLENLKMQGVQDSVQSVVGSTFDLVQRFSDNTVDFLFIDDNHEAGHVYRELIAWYPKMRSGGVLAGHDVSGIRDSIDKFMKEKGLTYRVYGDSYFLEINKNVSN